MIRGGGNQRQGTISSPVRLARKPYAARRIVVNNEQASLSGEGPEQIDGRSHRPAPPNALTTSTPAIKKVKFKATKTM